MRSGPLARHSEFWVDRRRPPRLHALGVCRRQGKPPHHARHDELRRHPAHQAANLAVFDFALTDEEMDAIADRRGGLTDRVLDALGLA